MQVYRAQASRALTFSRPDSKRPESKHPVVLSPSVQIPSLQSASAQSSRVQASRVQASKPPEFMRPESNRSGLQCPSIQSPSAQVSTVEESRPCVQSPAFPECRLKIIFKTATEMNCKVFVEAAIIEPMIMLTPLKYFNNPFSSNPFCLSKSLRSK